MVARRRKGNTEGEDRAFELAFIKALGHRPPFSAEECGTYRGHLTVVHARDLSALAACPQLTGLEICASSVPDLGALAKLKHLERVRIVCSDVEDLRPLIQCSAIDDLELVFTPLSDIRAIFQLPVLRSLQVVGCPLLPEIRQALLLLQHTQAVRVGLSNEADWAVTRTLHERGIAGSFGIWNGSSWFVRPGVPQIPNADCDVTFVPRPLLQSLMQEPHFSADRLFAFMGLSDRDSESTPHRFDFQGHLPIGSCEDARGWVQRSALWPSEKRALIGFTNRFSSVLWYAEDEALLNAVEARHRIRLPEWFRQTRQALAFPLPYHFVQFQADDVSLLSAEGGEAPWYELRLRGVDNDEQRGIIETNRLFPIGAQLPTAEHVLAIRLDDESDHSLYSYRVDNLDLQGRVPDDSIVTVSRNYAEFLTHISRLRLDTSEILEARP